MAVLRQELSAWRATPEELVSTRNVTTDRALQPRDSTVTRLEDAAHAEREAARQVEELTATLRGDASKELEPLLVASIDGVLYVTDGHHRRAAYRRAKRLAMPVRVRVMTKDLAVRLSRLVNLDLRAQALTPGEKMEAAWQHLIDVTVGGRFSLQQLGTQQREVADVFHISKSTVGNMLDRIALADEMRRDGKVPPGDRNAHSGWPTWTAIKRAVHPLADMEELPDRDGERIRDLAQRLAVWAQRDGMETVKAAMQLMLAETHAEAAEAAEAQEGCTDF